MSEVISTIEESGSKPEEASKLKNMPSHYVYVEAPDDAGNLMRVGAMWQHASGKGFGLRLDKGDTARQLVFEHGDDLVVLQNRRRMELAEKLEPAQTSGGANLKEETQNSFDQATHPNRVIPPPGLG